MLFLLAMGLGLVLIVVAALLAYQAIAEAGAFAVHPYLYLGLPPWGHRPRVGWAVCCEVVHQGREP